MRIVLDTNIIVSGLLSETGPPALLLKLWLQGKFELVTSRAQLDELSRVFQYKKIRERIPSDQAETILGQIDAFATVVDVLPAIDLSPDPDDNVILAAAIQAQADCIVSGDKSDLLTIQKAEKIPIITARQAVKRIDRK